MGYDGEGKAIYNWILTYPDLRVGSESCFFDPIHPKNFTFYSNPNSNCMLNNYSENYSRSILSDLKITNLRLESGATKADFTIGNNAYIISENTTLAAGQWYINKTITVNSGVTLTLQPGTILKFASGNYRLEVYGTLNAAGTADNPITFDFTSPYNYGMNGIVFENGSSGSLSYCVIKNANTGVLSYSSSSLSSITYCTITNC